GPQKVQKVMVQFIRLVLFYLQNHRCVQVIRLLDKVKLEIEGHIIGFNEYVN
ncbi:Probable small nuclear ribonucleoprotein E, partial [Harpegnathos saltator]